MFLNSSNLVFNIIFVNAYLESFNAYYIVNAYSEIKYILRFYIFSIALRKVIDLNYI